MQYPKFLTEAIRLLGFRIGDSSTVQDNPSFAIPQNTDGASTVQTGGIYGTYVDLEGTAKNEAELITRYRDMALQPECDQAITDIVNEAIVKEDYKPIVTLNMEQMDSSDDIKEKVRECFDDLLIKLNFNEDAADIFRRWYTDGRLFYHILINEDSPIDGIQELKYLDPRRIRKIREIKKGIENGYETVQGIFEYYIYNERGIIAPDANATTGLKIALDSICYVHSGQIDSLRNLVVSYLHKGIKPLNQLRAMEDAHVIYRLSRAAERRVYYIDVGNMPTQKAEQYVKSIMSDLRNKLVYDSQTGEVRDDKKFLSMQEDIFLPRREGGKGTEIDTLPAGQNLGQIEDIKFFQEKMYKSLHVPISRLKSDASFGLGRSAEIARDEYNFSKFIRHLQERFNHLFKELLRIQLLLKGIILKSDWEDIKEGLGFDYQKDQYYSQIRDGEILTGRLSILEQIEPYVGFGKFYSKLYVKKFVLFQTDEEIRRIKEEQENERDIEQEIADEEAARNAGVDIDGEPFLPDDSPAPGSTKESNSDYKPVKKNPFKKAKNNLEK